jgi:hypothetical protein
MPVLPEPMRTHYQTQAEIAAVVEGFEQCTIGKDAFTHREHLTVAVWYLRHSNPDQALDSMREGLFRFLNHHGVGSAKYKENLTVSWMTLIEATLKGLSPELSLLEVTNIVLERLGDPCLIADPQKPE